MIYFFNLAARAALANDNENDQRSFVLGAVGIRWDGKLVSSKNGAVHSTSSNYQTIPLSHAEPRLCRKLGKDGIVYVVRIARKDGSLAMARPCSVCQIILKSASVKKVYYSINSKHYGLWLPEKDQDSIFQL